MAKNLIEQLQLPSVYSHLLIGNKCTVDKASNRIGFVLMSCYFHQIARSIPHTHTQKNAHKFKHYGQLNSTFGQLGNLQGKDVDHKPGTIASVRRSSRCQIVVVVLACHLSVTRCELERSGNDWFRRGNFYP